MHVGAALIVCHGIAMEDGYFLPHSPTFWLGFFAGHGGFWLLFLLFLGLTFW